MVKPFITVACATAFALVSCSPVVTSNIIHTSQPLESVDDVVVLKDKEPIPDDAEWMGSVRVNGNGSYSKMEEMTRHEAWLNGARYVKIKDYSTNQGVRSDIHVMNSDLYKIDSYDPALTLMNANNARTPQPEFTPADYDDSPLYLWGGGELELARANDAGTHSITLSLGAGYSLSHRFSVELGGMYSSSSVDSNTDVNIICKGLGSSLVFHLPMRGNLQYIPQLEFQYLNYKVESFRFNFAGAVLVPLALQYRADDSMWGFQLSAGEFGVVFPLGDTANHIKPLYVLSLNSISLGIVKYF